MATNPKVFISYAWEDDIKEWVKILAEKLRSNSVDAMIDQWGLIPGEQLTYFIEKSISSSNFVLIVCTPKYKRKVDCREGGAGYEGNIISSEQYYKHNYKKLTSLQVESEILTDISPIAEVNELKELIPNCYIINN